MINLNTAIPETKSNTGLIIGGLLLAAGLGYYFFVYKPKQEAKLNNKQ